MYEATLIHKFLTGSRGPFTIGTDVQVGDPLNRDRLYASSRGGSSRSAIATRFDPRSGTIRSIVRKDFTEDRQRGAVIRADGRFGVRNGPGESRIPISVQVPGTPCDRVALLDPRSRVL